MKYLLSILLTALTSILPLAAANFPALYLRGGFNNWEARESERFALDESTGTYSLSIDRLDGSFKIADANWGDHIYGVGRDPFIGGSGAYEMFFQQAGVNTPDFKADNLTDVTIRFVYEEGKNLTMQITAKQAGADDPSFTDSGTLPVLHINVYTDATHSQLNDEIISRNLNHKNYFSDAEYWFDLNGCKWLEEAGAKSIGSAEEPLPLEIKGRGNWTLRGFAKKPFKLKLGKKQALCGLSKSKHFALLAHADDSYGYLRNFVGFNLGKRIGLPWTPAQQPIEVYINGNYRGLYFLTESIRVEPDRVNITELDDNVSDRELVSGGYLVELDNYEEDNQIRMEEKSCVDGQNLDMLRVTFDTPEVYSDLQRRFITEQFTAMNDAVGANSDQLWSYLDLDDAARYYIVEEIISNVESYHGSTYLFRDRGEGRKWHFTPLWDCGNAFNGPTNGFFYDNDPFGNTWIPSMRQNAKFNEKVRQTWLWFMQQRYRGVIADIDEYVEHITAAAKSDYRRWNGQPTPDGGQAVVDNRDMQWRRNAVVSHLESKTSWLSGVFGNAGAIDPGMAEPARDTTPAAPLPDYVGSGVENVAADNDDADAPVEYFDLMGRLLAEPAAGSIVIERRGSSVRKVRI